MLTLDLANILTSATLSRGVELHLKPLSVAVLDTGGHLLAFQRQDGASIMRPKIAIGKAAGALALGISSRAIAEIAAERPSFVSAVANVCEGGLIPAAGGIIITTSDGAVLGAIGVTGDTSDNDEICALAGIAAAGLMSQGA